MANYSKTTDFAAKDSLPTGNAGKIVKGTEIDDEFVAIQTAIATKLDTTTLDYKKRIVSYQQVVKASDTTMSGTNFDDLSMDLTLTPSTSTNKILIMVDVQVYHRQVDDSGAAIALYIDGVNTEEIDFSFYSSSNSVDTAGLGGNLHLIYLHAPGSTASIDYSVYGKCVFAGGNSTFYGTTSKITALELEA